jgi:hypothetical protein
VCDLINNKEGVGPMKISSQGCRRAVIAAVVTLVTALGSVLAGAPAASAAAGGAGPDQTPVMGWSSWSFLRFGVDTQRIEAEAKALVTSGLSQYGYNYVNIDDNWYQCPGPQGPNVDSNGLWKVDSTEFPSVGGENGIAAVADYVHSLGEKFGIYLTPGISKQAVAENTPVAGSSYTADQIATTKRDNNYNCGGMVGLNYSSPGAQDFVNSEVDELASWGVDYIKLDGITNSQSADVQAWSQAIAQSGRPMVLNITQGSYTTALAPTLDQYANQWEFSPDIEINGPDEGSADACNTAPFTGCKSVFPFTSYAHWFDRFADVELWQPYGGQGGFNDYDSIEVGDGSARSGMSPSAEKSQLSLWALGSAPLILGVNLTKDVTNAFGSSGGLIPSGLRMLENRSVISVDQDAIDASRISDVGNAQVFSKMEPAGDAVVGLFNTNQAPKAGQEWISTTAAALGLPADNAGYELDHLWSGKTVTISAKGKIRLRVAPEGVDLLKVTPIGSGS